MTRDIYIRTKTGVRRYPLTKNCDTLTIVNKGLYRTDEKFMRRDDSGDHEFIVYPANGIQPYFLDEIVDPDETMALLTLAKRARNIGKVSRLSGINPNWILYGMIGVVVIFTVITGGIA